jgi:hypothetical protein
MLGNVSFGSQEVSRAWGLLELLSDPQKSKAQLGELANAVSEAHEAREKARIAANEANERKANADRADAELEHKTANVLKLQQRAEAKQLRAEQSAREAEDRHECLMRVARS